MTDPRTRSVLGWTVAVAVVVAAASTLGLADDDVYARETENWAAQARGQDIGNLLAVVTLGISGLGYARGSHRAGLVWLGTLLYLVYAYVIYAMAVRFNDLFLLYVAALGLSAYAAMFSVPRLRRDSTSLPPRAACRLAGWTSVAIGVLFTALWLSELVPATVSGEVPQSVEDAGLAVNPVHVIDLAVLLPALVGAGWLTLRGDCAGGFLMAPLLTFSVLMGTSIVAAMIWMTVEGFEDTLPPLVMVSLVVALSAVAGWRYLAGTPGPGPNRDRL